ncbi:MAG: FkbM family methyltransferase [Oscillospiraceae bacterium]|nr:FkbM family methyltransferase [Oscillospiraceae bacterium]
MANDLFGLPFELRSLPETLKNAGLPVYLYGMGDGADKALAYLDAHGIHPRGVFASEDFVRPGAHFRSFPVEKLSDVEAREGKIAAILCFGTEGEEAERLLRPLMERHLLRVPPFPVYGEGMLERERLFARKTDAERVYGWLSDELSRALFRDVLAFQMTGDPAFLFSHWNGADVPPKAYFSHDGLHLDVGAYDGETARDYLARNPRCKGVWAFEPNEASFRKLCIATAPAKVRPFHAACGDRDGTVSLSAPHGRGTHLGEGEGRVRVCKLDTVCSYPTVNAPNGEAVGSLHIDAEGEDANVLYGSANLITSCRPCVGISAYHRAGDLLDLPLLLKRLCYRSELFFRKKPCVPAWDTEFYLIPTIKPIE